MLVVLVCFVVWLKLVLGVVGEEFIFCGFGLNGLIYFICRLGFVVVLMVIVFGFVYVIVFNVMIFLVVSIVFGGVMYVIVYLWIGWFWVFIGVYFVWNVI